MYQSSPPFRHNLTNCGLQPRGRPLRSVGSSTLQNLDWTRLPAHSRENSPAPRPAVASGRARARLSLALPALTVTLALATSATALPLPRLPALTTDARDTREAEAIAQQVWNRALVHCGPDVVFALEGSTDTPKVLRKTRFVFTPTNDQLTPADRLNGTEWQGYFYINSAAYRTLASDDGAAASDAPSGRWGPWQDNFTDSVQAGFRIRKFKGQWQIRSYAGDDQYSPFNTMTLKSMRVSCRAPDAPLLSR